MARGAGRMRSGDVRCRVSEGDGISSGEEATGSWIRPARPQAPARTREEAQMDPHTDLQRSSVSRFSHRDVSLGTCTRSSRLAYVFRLRWRGLPACSTCLLHLPAPPACSTCLLHLPAPQAASPRTVHGFAP